MSLTGGAVCTNDSVSAPLAAAGGSASAGGRKHDGEEAAADFAQRKYKWLVEIEPAVPGDGDRHPSLTPVYRHIWSKDGFPTLPFGITTCFDIWRISVQRNGPARCLGWRRVTPEGRPGPYTFISYNEADQQVALLSAGLAAAGLRAGDRVAVYGANSPEWMIVLQACNRMNYTCVPVYDTLGRDAAQFILNHSGASALFVSWDKMKSVIAALEHVTAPLVLLVDWGPRPMGHLATSSCGGRSNDSASEFGAPFGNIGNRKGDLPYIRRMTFSELLEAGARQGAVPAQPPAPEDLTTLMYTSGTTGEPKGVQLPHSAVVAAVAALAGALEHYDEPVGPGDSVLSYLPLAHIFDRVSEETCLAAGASIGYWFGDVARLGEDAAALKPSVFIGVPRVYDKIFDTVQGRLEQVNWVRRSIFQAMYDRRLQGLRGGARPDAATLRLPLPAPIRTLSRTMHFGSFRRDISGRSPAVTAAAAPSLGKGLTEAEEVVTQPTSAAAVESTSADAAQSFGAPQAQGLGLGLLDSIVFGRIRRGLGGRLRLVVSGGAPLSPRVEEFLRVTMGCPVAQGYGLTETCAASFMQEPYHWEQFGSVGPPLLCTEFRLRSIPDMGYLAEGAGEQCELPAGELLLRGPQLFTGYYGRPDLTKEALVIGPGNLAPEETAATQGESSDPRVGRWFCTGDIAALRPDGSLEIVDRIKNLFKLSQGEYISPERLEAVYSEAHVVEQIWVYGDSRKNALVAVVVPQRNALVPLAGCTEIKGRVATAAEPAGAVASPWPPSPQRQRTDDAGDPGPLTTQAEEEKVYGAEPLTAAAVGEVEVLCESARVTAAVLQQLQEVGRANHLRGFEMVRAVHLVPEPFTPDNDMMTPTLKLKRPALLRRFRGAIEDMYEQLSRI